MSCNKKQTLYDYFETTNIVRASDRQNIRYMARPIFEEYIDMQDVNCNDKYFNFKIQRYRDLNDRKYWRHTRPRGDNRNS